MNRIDYFYMDNRSIDAKPNESDAFSLSIISYEICESTKYCWHDYFSSFDEFRICLTRIFFRNGSGWSYAYAPTRTFSIHVNHLGPSVHIQLVVDWLRNLSKFIFTNELDIEFLDRAEALAVEEILIQAKRWIQYQEWGK